MYPVKHPRKQLPRLYPRRGIIKDDAVFAFNYSPTLLPSIRKSQLRKLLLIFAPLIEMGIPRNALIQGNMGTGKTSLARNLSTELEAAGRKAGRRVVVETINCCYRNSSSEILHYLLASRFRYNAQERGLSVPQLLEFLWKKLCEKHMHLVVILDNADYLFRTEGPALINNLLQFNVNEESFRESISVVMTSILEPWEFMDLSVSGMFVPQNIIHLPHFNKGDLMIMLQNMAKSGLQHETWNRNTLRLIAQYSATSGGGNHQAMDLLLKAALLAEGDRSQRIRPEHIEEATAA